ncbi:NACHT domain-containing protein [Streptomonospora alba]|uniref:NACHT domain-containing protein n=1 Tax=Streptomonospora alba TaxID=183763 RepID=UPI00069BDA00|nr:ATP-binding protein [Streptomonospora alba]
MAKRLGYADALKVLGQDDSAVLDFAEKLAGGGLGALGLPGLSSAGGAIAQTGRRALTGIREKITGISRMDRTERVMAAHNILVAVAVFEALDEVLEESRAPLRLSDLDPQREEQLFLCERVLGEHLVADPAGVDGGRFVLSSGADTAEMIAIPLAKFVRGLAVWEGMDATTRHAAERAIGARLPALARRRFVESYRQLAADIPEFGVWAAMAEHEATQQRVADLDTGMEGLRSTVEAMDSPKRTLDRRRSELCALYRAALDRRVLRSADAPPGLTLPTLESGYLTPRGRFTLAFPADRPSTENWWRDVPLHEDVESLLAGLLTVSEATEAPIVVLGHPGAGKSVLTEMLAARLSVSDFFAMRVELRAVPPNAPLHVQIEEGLAAALKTRVDWRELAASAGGALPVVILDGLDELVQASGIDRSDYLEQVQEFQRHQDALGQPVAVIVTSRTVVAERTRFPVRTPVLRLEPFNERQIARMVGIWGHSNESAYLSRGLQPPTTEALLAYRELAEQPLLLLMLLIYDSGANSLQRSGEALSRGELYEELLRMFSEREVRKHRPNLTDQGLADAVEEELHRLEVVAIAMFVRRRQHVTAAELDGDLTALMPDAGQRSADADLHGAVSDAHQVLGRFFFVHESRAETASGTASVFEFLHATFGEYLVARAVTDALDDLLEARRFAARRPRAAPPVDDGLLYALTSFALLAGSAAMVEFTEDLLRRRFTGDPAERADYRELLLELFREAHYPPENRSYTAYRPRRLPITERQAAYTANLVLLLTRVAPEGVDIAELFDNEHGWENLSDWRALAGQWRGLANAQWHGLLDAVQLRHVGYDGHTPRTVLLPLEADEEANVGECVGFEITSDTRDRLSVIDPYSITVPSGITRGLLRSTAMRINGTPARMTLMLLPYLAHVGTDLLSWREDTEERTVWSRSHEVLSLRLALPSADPDEQQRRLRSYVRLLSTEALGTVEALALRQAAEDLAYIERVGSETGDTYRTSLLSILEDFLAGIMHYRDFATQVPADAVHPALEQLSGQAKDADVDGTFAASCSDVIAAMDGGEFARAAEGSADRPRSPRPSRRDPAVEEPFPYAVDSGDRGNWGSG